MGFAARRLRGLHKVRTEEEELDELKQSWKFGWENGKLRCQECGKRMRSGEVEKHACSQTPTADGIPYSPYSQTPTADSFPSFSSKKSFWWEHKRFPEEPKPPSSTRKRCSFDYYSWGGKREQKKEVPQPPSGASRFPSISQQPEDKLKLLLSQHNQKWNEFLVRTAPVECSSVPWPTDVIQVLPLVSEQKRKSVARELLRRFHPDKFITSIQHLCNIRAAAISELQSNASDVAKKLTSLK
eukprot:TRINITY_DN4882_c0_g3_i2.p1 TRINITY_DN4882_c0_g3~~TRINITY_DN4882_c0_g3_i2.p1  ORF type:complete len:241 (+),score=45.91 TRINITY_DN4882_c0_g3_i2:73-795(+)